MTASVLFSQRRDGSQRTEFPQAAIRSYGDRLNAAGALSATIAARRLPDAQGRYTIPLIEALEVGVHEIGVQRANRVVWLGPLAAVEETDGTNGPGLDIQAEGLATYLWDTIISLPELSGASPPGQFRQVDQAVIAHSILEHVTIKSQQVGNWWHLDITGVDTPTGVRRDRTEYQTYRGLIVGEEIEKLGSVAGGFDWDITPERRFRLHYPKRGRQRSDVSLNPTNIIDLRRQAVREQSSSVVGFGDGFAEGTVRRRHTDTEAVEKYGLTERTLSMSNTTRAATIDANTQALLRQVAQPVDLLSVKIRWGASLSYGSIVPGDEIMVEWPRSIYRPISEWQRIVGIDYHPADDTATVHVAALEVT